VTHLAPLQECPDTIRLNDTRRVYESIVSLIAEISGRDEPDTTLALIEKAAWFAYMTHPGLFADARLENLALRIGRAARLRPGSGPQPSFHHLRASSSKRRVLHVITTAFHAGGNCRTVSRWAECDRKSEHRLLVTNQFRPEFPEWLEAAFRPSGGVVVLPPSAPVLTRALLAREVIDSFAPDLIISHHCAHDVVPTVAFARPGGPPVTTINQADHVFWLGSSVTDVITNLRLVSERVNHRRGGRPNDLLPIPLGKIGAGVSREHARATLGLSPDDLVLVSVGRGVKYAPTGGHNFYRAAARILDRCPLARLFLVGVGWEEAVRQNGGAIHLRVNCVGPVSDPTVYQAAADVYLEGYPFGSQTALLEACLAGAVVARAPNPVTPLLVADDPAIQHLPVSPSEDTYVESVCQLLADPAARRWLADMTRQQVGDAHATDGWLGRLSEWYDRMSRREHRPCELIDTDSPPTTDDFALCAFHAQSAAARGEMGLTFQLREFSFEGAYAASRSGDYRSAVRIALAAGRRGVDLRTVSLLCKLPAYGWFFRWCAPGLANDTTLPPHRAQSVGLGSAPGWSAPSPRAGHRQPLPAVPRWWVWAARELVRRGACWSRASSGRADESLPTRVACGWSREWPPRRAFTRLGASWA
jgi:hypothetical protein